jgi:hypothetical protein
LRIALLQHKPIGGMLSGGDAANLNILRVLKNVENSADIRIYAIGKRSYTTRINGMEQHVIKGNMPPEWRLGIWSPVDVLLWYALGFRVSTALITKNDKFISELERFDPDIILPQGGVQMLGILDRYRAQHKHVKMIVYMDPPKLIKQMIEGIIKELNIPTNLKPIVDGVFTKRYVDYSIRLYNKLLDAADGIVTPTEGDRSDIVEGNPKAKGKVFVIPPIIVEHSKSMRKIKKIKTVLFVGACNYPPNSEAISYIENTLAPRFPDKEFWVTGRYCDGKESKNFKVLGGNVDLKKCMKKVDLCIAPLTYGGGMKTKIFSYLSANKPTIGTDVAFEGFKIKNRINGIVENDINKFPDRILELDRDMGLYQRLQRNIPTLMEEFSLKEISKGWARVLKYVKVD